MISGLYSAATGMDAASVRHEVSAENLAHAHLPGYRRRVVHQTTFDQLLKPGGGGTPGYHKTTGTTAGVEGNRQIAINFQQGTIKQTGRRLDVALDGDGFFAVEGPNGPLYTRNGSFWAYPDGQLVTVDGLTVNGVNGAILVPPNTSSEAIAISSDGRLSANGVEFGQLEIVDIADKGGLVSVGASLFQAPDTADIQPSEDQVIQGYVEGSNVSHMEELVNIMVASRQYEAAQRALRTIDEAVGRHINNGR